MQIQFEKMPQTARIWIYQTNRALNDGENKGISMVLEAKMAGWAAHGAELLSAFKIYHNRFVVVALDENLNAASGCSIDASTNWFKELGQQMDLDFFDRSLAFLSDEDIITIDFMKIKEAIFAEKITPNTIIFNNLVPDMASFIKSWNIEAKNSWLQKYFQLIQV